MSDYTPTEDRIVRYTHPTYGKVVAVSENYWETMIASVKAAERERVLAIIQARHDDLASCHKQDDCGQLAEGIRLALSDVEEVCE